MSLKNFRYTVLFSIVSHFICSAIIALDLFSQNETVLLNFDGKKTQLHVSNLTAIPEVIEFRPSVIDPPKIFSDELNKVNPIATNFKHSNEEDFEFMQNEITDLLKKGIVRCLRSSLRVQTFAVKGQKRRMVIDYSMRVKLFTSLDAYLFPKLEELLNNASGNHFFSKVDLKSAYHQLPLKEEDKQFTAFEFVGKLYNFICLPFGVTNAVPAFQRIDRNMLERMYTDFDD